METDIASAVCEFLSDTNTNKQTLVHHSDIKKSRMGLKLRERKYSGVKKIYFFGGDGWVT